MIRLSFSYKYIEDIADKWEYCK